MPVRRLPVRPNLGRFIVRLRNSSAPSTPGFEWNSQLREHIPNRSPRCVEAGLRAARARAELPRVELDEAVQCGATNGRIWRET